MIDFLQEVLHLIQWKASRSVQESSSHVAIIVPAYRLVPPLCFLLS
jgi:hypothetical protein